MSPVYQRHAPSGGPYRTLYLPDTSIVCGEAVFLDAARDTLTNPTVIFEVLSPSTEAYDRGRKWSHYRQLSSLQEYSLISQCEPLIEKFTRQEGLREWSYAAYEGLAAVVELTSVGCRLALIDVYDRITFPPAAGGPQGGETR